ncbi:hypothetical protein WG66_012716, partial [Moniliophthora roreri]
FILPQLVYSWYTSAILADHKDIFSSSLLSLLLLTLSFKIITFITGTGKLLPQNSTSQLYFQATS